MKKKTLLIAIFFFILLIIITPAILVNHRREKQNQVCFENHCFNVELAITPEERNRGLMFRGRLDFNGGMLFVFEREGKYPFWMKNTLIPLDIIWINENKEVVFISENTRPCEEYSCLDIDPAKNAKYVLEINGNISKNIGLKVGDIINLKIE